MRKIINVLILLALVGGMSSLLWAKDFRTIQDQLGREVKVPTKVTRIVVLEHHSLDVLVQLGAQKDIVGVLSSWKRRLGANFVRFMPSIKTMPMPGDLRSVNIESLLKLKPQVVFVTNYAPTDMINKIQNAGIAVLAISFTKNSKADLHKMNPSPKDAKKAYKDGLTQTITIMAEVLNKKKLGKELIKAAFSKRAMIAKRLKTIKPDERVKVYMANPKLHTYGKGKYTALMMRLCGASNVAAKSLKGYKQVSLEQVIKWQPKVIFIQHRYANVLNEIKADSRWQLIPAVKNHKVYLLPQYAKAWGHPLPEATSLGELYISKTLYPKLFKDIDMNKEVSAYYKKFYKVSWKK